jgi:hypothetical protein
LIQNISGAYSYENDAIQNIERNETEDFVIKEKNNIIE